MRKWLAAVGLAIAAGMAGSAQAVTTYEFAGDFTQVSVNTSLPGIPSSLLTGPVPFDITFTSTSNQWPVATDDTLTIGNGLVLSHQPGFDDVVATADARFPEFAARYMLPSNPMFEMVIIVGHPVDAEGRTDPTGPPTRGLFVVDQTMLNSVYPQPLFAEVDIFSTAHGGVSLSNAVFTKATVTGPPITLDAPEPSTWAMLILGFGATGAVLRRRRATLAAAP